VATSLGAHERPVRQLGAGETPAELQAGEQRRGPRQTQAVVLEGLDRGGLEPGQPTVVAQQLMGQVEHGDALAPGAQDESHQLHLGERLAAQLEKPLPGAFVGGDLAYHAG
jgi:hypothetical protein